MAPSIFLASIFFRARVVGLNINFAFDFYHLMLSLKPVNQLKTTTELFFRRSFSVVIVVQFFKLLVIEVSLSS